MTQLAVTYALERPIHEHGGLAHMQQALKGTDVTPANYKFVGADGTQLVYHICGRGPILIVGAAPGWGVGLNYMPTALQPMVDSGHVTFIVLQPHGTLPSQHPSDSTRMSSMHMAEDLEALRLHLQQETLTVLGHSNGATIALAYAVAFPKGCARAILVDAMLVHCEGEAERVQRYLDARRDNPLYADAVRAYTSLQSFPQTTRGRPSFSRTSSTSFASTR